MLRLYETYACLVSLRYTLRKIDKCTEVYTNRSSGHIWQYVNRNSFLYRAFWLLKQPFLHFLFFEYIPLFQSGKSLELRFLNYPEPNFSEIWFVCNYACFSIKDSIFDLQYTIHSIFSASVITRQDLETWLLKRIITLLRFVRQLICGFRGQERIFLDSF